MSFFGNNAAFEWFNLKDMLSKAKDNPEALLVGGMEPAGAELWKALGVLDKDFEPAVNVWGGPMGGGLMGTDKSGGVYERAGASGIDTSDAAGAHTVGEMVAAMFAGNYGADKLGGLLGNDQAGSAIVNKAPSMLGGGGYQQPDIGNASQMAQAREQQKRKSLLNYRLG